MFHYALLVLFLFTVGTHSVQAKDRSFSFHLIYEPHSLDPAQIRGSSGSYLFHNVFRSLYRYSRQEGLVLESAEKCTRPNSLKMICKLKKEIKYSDGSPVLAQDFERSFKRLMDPKTKSIQTELLLSLKNASGILKNKVTAEKLGVRALDDRTLEFQFAYYDSEFEYKLISTTLAPLKSNVVPSRKEALVMPTNGPYRFKSWKPGHKIVLEPNPYYSGAEYRPEVEIFMVEDNTTALNLYRAKKINFLRRVATHDIPIFEKRKDYRAFSMARFDYMGFGPELIKYPNLRKAMVYSLKYKELQKLYFSKGKPGCPSLPSQLMDKVPCFSFDLKKAKAALKKVPAEALKRRWVLQFSKLGGEDHLKGMQWFQNQWKNHLGLKIDLEAREQGMYLQDLRYKPSPLFRKGIGMDRPTCLAGLEVFDQESRENYIRLKEKGYQKILDKLQKARNPKTQKKICRTGVEFLQKNYRLIPMGEMYFSMMARDSFSGWDVNELNQLDLTELRRVVK